MLSRYESILDSKKSHSAVERTGHAADPVFVSPASLSGFLFGYGFGGLRLIGRTADFLQPARLKAVDARPSSTQIGQHDLAFPFIATDGDIAWQTGSPHRLAFGHPQSDAANDGR